MKEFLNKTASAASQDELVKLTLSKPIYKSNGLQNIFVRCIEVKKQPKLSFVHHYKTKDITKNFDLQDGYQEIETLIMEKFKNATLMTTTQTFQLLRNKKGKVTISESASAHSSFGGSHDHQKLRRVNLDAPYLLELGITDSQGKLIPKMADKYRQINKYLEIMDNLITHSPDTKSLNVVDMGAGKGYLTFALYDFLNNKKSITTKMTGIELRQDLVEFCNAKAQKCGFDDLTFINQRIEEYSTDKIDVLIALHACDTATDDALAKAITTKADLIVCAPCCHKQVRQQVKGKDQESPLLKYGIFHERHFEMITDTIRALILEQHGYESKIFEFVSNEHTRKNVMLVGSPSHKVDKDNATKKIEALKKEYHIDYQYLEQLVNFS